MRVALETSVIELPPTSSRRSSAHRSTPTTLAPPRRHSIATRLGTTPDDSASGGRYAGPVREDISDERSGAGWVRVTCDAPLCAASVEGRPRLGEDWPPGWAQDVRRKPLTPDDPRDYCPDHIPLATA